jgi:hypothetical protein
MTEWNDKAVEALRGHDILKNLKAMRFFGRSYSPPNFLVAVPEQYHRDTAAPHEAGHGTQSALSRKCRMKSNGSEL